VECELRQGLSQLQRRVLFTVIGRIDGEDSCRRIQSGIANIKPPHGFCRQRKMRIEASV
jgi:hypothetical protein